MRSVVLTDESGAPKGTAEIVDAHTGAGKLHKAFSVFIFRNGMRELLLQKRSPSKMLFPQHWGNTCCSHPRENEDIVAAGERRLFEECGFRCDLEEVASFVYRAVDPGGRGTEHEHDTVLVGQVDDVEPKPDPEEIAEMKWMSVDDLQTDLKAHPERYGPWLPLGLSLILKHGS